MSVQIKSLIEILQEVTTILENNQIEYMVVGSIASTTYGEARLTKDIDLVIEVGPSVVGKFLDWFDPNEYYLPHQEALKDEYARQGEFNLIHLSSGFKVDFVFRKNNEHSKTEFLRRAKVELFPGLSVSVASPEDVIIKKLMYYCEGLSEKHLTDVKGILMSTPLDDAYLDSWVTALNLKDAMKRARNIN